MWLYIPLVVGIVLAIASFLIGLWPVGVVLLIATALAGASRLRGAASSPSAARAQRQEERDPTDPLPPAHEGQAHMTPDEIPSPRP